MTSERLQLGGDEVAFRVTSEESGDAFVAIDVRMGSGGGPRMLHRHAPAELYRVEHGELALYVADEHGEIVRTVAGAGQVVAIPGGREHTIRNESSEEARALAVFTPGAPMERFIRAAAALREPDMGAVLALAADYGIDMTRELEEVVARSRTIVPGSHM
jgi:oxalate decarboxylase/phosphoglucose isomerase-like protein (cupin superfamily)